MRAAWQKMETVALTLFRVTVGVIMAVHGYDKLMNIDAVAQGFGGLGIPYPKIATYLAIAGELGGGLGLIFGLLTPIAAFGVLCVMAVAVTQVHWSHGLLAKNNGFEYPLTLFMAALFFIFHGAGPISLDHIFFCKKKSEL